MPDTPVPGWKVIRQMPASGLDAAGRPTAGVEVTIETTDGHTGQVFIPNSHYTPDRARRMLADHAATVSAVGNMTEPPK